MSSKIHSVQNSSNNLTVPKNTIQTKSHVNSNQKNSINVEFKTQMDKGDGYKATMTMTLMHDADAEGTRNSIVHE